MSASLRDLVRDLLSGVERTTFGPYTRICNAYAPPRLFPIRLSLVLFFSAPLKVSDDPITGRTTWNQRPGFQLSNKFVI